MGGSCCDLSCSPPGCAAGRPLGMNWPTFDGRLSVVVIDFPEFGKANCVTSQHATETCCSIATTSPHTSGDFSAQHPCSCLSHSHICHLAMRSKSGRQTISPCIRALQKPAGHQPAGTASLATVSSAGATPDGSAARLCRACWKCLYYVENEPEARDLVGRGFGLQAARTLCRNC